ncbi:MAG TPA: hypothetical protein VE954_19835 [Oligoflexus sp.]|uniref:alginate O-acetyltransferase AlgX-related protein n=1 Tax=Oligoflexus sp. TaxID=1971216 RepID=UPI002D6FD8AF|nr:hypothetical protein [Oligoflexus sp.]HYX35353.1 hypothetical protein [Oligoflexus sp.]
MRHVLIVLLVFVALLQPISFAMPSLRSEHAKIGRDGWLIFTAQQGGNIRDYRRQNLRSEQELENAYQAVRLVQSKLESMGSHFVWIVIPNTPTVYPESMPKHIKQKAGPSRLEQLAEYLQRRGIHFIHATSAMRQAKTLGQLYQKTDTHWNELGAYIGYKTLLDYLRTLDRRFSSQLEPLDLEHITVNTFEKEGGDLAGMLALQDILHEQYTQLLPKIPREARTTGNPETVLVSRKDTQCPGPTLAMYRDSFSNLLQPFVSEHFCEAEFYWKWEVDRELLLKRRPSYVVFQNIERFTDDALNGLIQLAQQPLATIP